MGYSVGQSRDVINWSKKIVLVAHVNNIADTTNRDAALTFGKIAADGIGDLAAKGIGVWLDNGALKGKVHDGTTLTTIDLSTTLTIGHHLQNNHRR